MGSKSASDVGPFYVPAGSLSTWENCVKFDGNNGDRNRFLYALKRQKTAHFLEVFLTFFVLLTFFRGGNGK